MAGNLEPAGGPLTSPPARRERLEPIASQPLRRGCCDWCGRRTPRGRVYCNSTCRERYNALVTRQGKALVQSLKLWRLYRGRRGTAGAACGRKSLSSARIQAIFTSNDTPLGECRVPFKGFSLQTWHYIIRYVNRNQGGEKHDRTKA